LHQVWQKTNYTNALMTQKPSITFHRNRQSIIKELHMLTEYATNRSDLAEKEK